MGVLDQRMWKARRLIAVSGGLVVFGAVAVLLTLDFVRVWTDFAGMPIRYGPNLFTVATF